MNKITIKYDLLSKITEQLQEMSMMKLKAILHSTVQYVTGCTLKGYKVTGKDDYATASIFLPAAGYCFNDSSRNNQGSSGAYWSSTPGSSPAYLLSFSSSNKSICGNNRNYGYSVRAILAETI